MQDETPRRRRSGGRAGNARRSSPHVIQQSSWRMPINVDRPTDPLTEGAVERMHDTAMRILEEIGIEFLNEEALELFKEAGCKVDGANVKMGRDWVMEMVGKAPAEFTLMPRNPERQLTVGGKVMLFGNVSSPPNYWDLETGKTPGTREQCANLLKLTQYFNCIHFAGGYPVEPVDIHASVRHLDVVYDKLTLTDKVMHAYSLGKERVEDVMEMVKIAGGLSEDDFRSRPHMYTNINSTSPLKHDQPMIDGCLRCVRRGQAVVVTPFTLAGAMAPGDNGGGGGPVPGRGAVGDRPVPILGTRGGLRDWDLHVELDMKSGAPAFGTPEYMRATQMTVRWRAITACPWRASGVCTANVPDGQAMWETSNSLWAALQSGTNMVYHAAGWLEGGLIASPEKFIMDCEVLQMMQRYLEQDIWGTEERMT